MIRARLMNAPPDNCSQAWSDSGVSRSETFFEDEPCPLFFMRVKVLISTHVTTRIVVVSGD